MNNWQAIVVAVSAGLAASWPQPAMAQAWIGEMVGNMMAQQQAAANEAACMRGTPPAESERVEALGPANAQLHSYFKAMQSGSAPRSAFFHLDKKTAWSNGTTRLDRKSLDTGSDPLAAPATVLAEQPHAFHRSYLDASALGQWAVRDTAGRTVGVYNALFVRRAGAWKLRSLNLEDGSSYSGPVAQFCHEPGDVLPYRIQNATMRQEFHGTRLAKAQARHAKAVKTLADAEAALADRPDNAAARTRVAQARAQVEKWDGEITERKAGLAEADTDLAAALADKEALPALRAATMAELGLTG